MNLGTNQRASTHNKLMKVSKQEDEDETPPIPIPAIIDLRR
jgi:hypothetical protein